MSQSSRRQTPFLVAGDAQEGGPALGAERHRKMGVRIFQRVAEGGSLSCTCFVLIINLDNSAITSKIIVIHSLCI